MKKPPLLPMAEPLPLQLPYPWQQSQWQSWDQRRQAQRLAHAVMISGAEGIGKQRLALSMANRLLCLDLHGLYPCGRCKGCQLLASGSHRDLYRLQPEPKSRFIKVDAVRELSRALAQSGQQGGWKVAIIEPAEAMNTAAANALLKTLEEPDGQTLIILLSARPSAVPATVRSRCQKWVMPLPRRSEALPWLQAVANSAECEQQLDAAAGRPLLALQSVSSGELAARQQLQQQLQQVTAQTLSPLRLAEQLSRSGEPALHWFKQLLEQLLRSQSLQPAIDRDTLLALFALRDSTTEALSWLHSGNNPSLQSLWETLLLSWLRLPPLQYSAPFSHVEESR